MTLPGRNFKVYVIGFSQGTLAPGAKEALSAASQILVSENLLPAVSKLLSPSEEKKLFPYRRFSEALTLLEAAKKQELCLAFIVSGDPLLFGAGRILLERFGPGVVEILPAVSFPQLAFSRFKLPWEDFFFLSLHGGDKTPRKFALSDLPGLLRRHGKVCVFTDKDHGPREIAAYLAPRVPEEDLRFLVAERVGLSGERLREWKLREAERKTFASPNLVLLLYQGPGLVRGFGLSSTEILHPRGLITKDEVRAVVLHRLRLPERGVLWDVGAGAGGVSTEAARSHPLLRVFSVERDPQRRNYLLENRRRFGLLNLEVIAGEAPEALHSLPAPDRIFIGGSGGRLAEILEFCTSLEFPGPLVLTLVSLENLSCAEKILSRQGFDLEVAQISVFRSRRLSGHTLLSPENPVFVLRAERRVARKGDEG